MRRRRRGDIEILREGGDLHYRVKEPIWGSGLSFDEFVAHLMQFFIPE
jgi:hypothetical protein